MSDQRPVYIPNEFRRVAAGLRKHHAALVYTVIASHTDDTGAAWPGVNGIADTINSDDKTVRRAIQQLLKMGMIEVNPRPGTTPIYRLTPPTRWEYPRDGSTHDVGGHPSHRMGGHPSHAVGAEHQPMNTNQINTNQINTNQEGAAAPLSRQGDGITDASPGLPGGEVNQPSTSPDEPSTGKPSTRRKSKSKRKRQPAAPPPACGTAQDVIDYLGKGVTRWWDGDNTRQVVANPSVQQIAGILCAGIAFAEQGAGLPITSPNIGRACGIIARLIEGTDMRPAMAPDAIIRRIRTIYGRWLDIAAATAWMRTPLIPSSPGILTNAKIAELVELIECGKPIHQSANQYRNSIIDHTPNGGKRNDKYRFDNE